MINWINFIESYDTKHLQRDSNKKRSHCQEASNAINISFMKLMGIDASLKNVIRQRIKIELLYMELLRTGNQTLLTIIALKEAELSRQGGGYEKVNYYNVWDGIEKYFGFRLPSDVTVFEFFNKLKYINQETEKERKQLEKWQKARK